MQKVFFLRSATLQGCPLSSALEILAPTQRQREEIIDIRFGKEETKVLFFVQNDYLFKQYSEHVQISY